MELYPAEVERLKGLLGEWVGQTNRELEASFSNASDTTTFLAVAQRLRSKGFTPLPQEDHMKIMTPENVRFTITGLTMIEQYCRNNDISTTNFEVMRKDYSGKENNLDVSDYGLRVKIRREIPLETTGPAVDATLKHILANWGSQQKAFRILRRWSFLAPGIRFDLSMVRSTLTDSKGTYKWQKTFGQKDITKNRPVYEIEVELLRPEDTSEGVIDRSLKALIRGIGEVLRGIQKHHLLIRNTKADAVMKGYTSLTGSSRFRGVAPITMTLENFGKKAIDGVSNIRTGYNVTDKADGLRMMGYVNSNGELFMIDMSLHVYRTGLRKESLKDSLVDGEYVTQDSEKNPIMDFILFDCYIAPNKKNISGAPFRAADGSGRHAQLEAWIKEWNDGDGPIVIAGSGAESSKARISVSMKVFLFAEAGNTSIFAKCKDVLDTKKRYHTDGLILTTNTGGLPDRPGVTFREQLKWKPADENTVDFLCKFDKVVGSINEDEITSATMKTGELIQYKTMRLYVGSDLDPAFENPRSTILFEQPLPGIRGSARKITSSKVSYRPVLFNPIGLPDTLASVCYVELQTIEGGDGDFITCENGDPIQDQSIVEMRYEPGNEPGWRWIPMRIRYDKTERYQAAQRTGNYGGTMNKDAVAESVWDSIHQPITHHMIRTGNEQPSSDEIAAMSGAVSAVSSGEVARVYYDRSAPVDDISLITGLRAFHNMYIKEEVLLNTALGGGGKSILDLACGQGGDIGKWVRNKVDFAFGIDIAGEGIRDPYNGAYRRYMNEVLNRGGTFDKIGKMIFAIGNSGKNIASGEAGATVEESDIMKAILGRISPERSPPPFVEKYGMGRLRQGADCVAVMFAIHYFFENETTLHGLIQNINESLKVGGYFVGCCFDGETVFKALQGINEDSSLVGKDKKTGSEVWKLTKRYSAKTLTADKDSLGLPIDVEFLSIGTKQTEFIMPFELLKAKMEEIGCRLMNADECVKAGLAPYKESSAMFEDSFKNAKKEKRDMQMSPIVMQYSFFNRWFIFKRYQGTGVPTGEDGAAIVGAPSMAAVVGAPSMAAVVGAPSTAAPTAAATANGAPSTTSGPLTLGEGTAPKDGVKDIALLKQNAVVAKGGPGESAANAAVVEASLRTLPVTKQGKAAAAKTYKLSELFQFYIGADSKDYRETLGLDEPDAARWLDPSAPVDIEDPDTQIVYPTITHFIAAMKYKYGSNFPQLAVSLFSSSQGNIHAKYLRKHSAEAKGGKLPLNKYWKLLAEEKEEVLLESSVTQKNEGMQKYEGLVFNEGAWFQEKDRLLELAIRQRWEKDARLRKIVEAIRNKGKLLLYYTGDRPGSELGGYLTKFKLIDGENKVGIMLMKIAGFANIA
jgi:SAM-dependent methyltransferase